MTNGQVDWESYIAGPRYAAVGDMLRKSVLAYRSAGYDISLTKLEVSKGLLRETTYFTLSGDRNDILTFQTELRRKLGV